MRFGICCSSFDEAHEAVHAGFDYVEMHAATFGGSDAAWSRDAYRGLPLEATNVFFSDGIRLFGASSADPIEYAKSTIERAAELGVRVMVIGSGAARRHPVGVAAADQIFASFVAEIAIHARKVGIALAPESLNRTETNTGNDLGTLAVLLRERGVGYTADSYHVLYEWNANGREGGLASPSEQLLATQIPFAPAHVHIADLPRNAPDPDDPMMRGFCSRLVELGYDGRVSLECNRTGKTLEQALADLHSLLDKFS